MLCLLRSVRWHHAEFSEKEVLGSDRKCQEDQRQCGWLAQASFEVGKTQRWRLQSGGTYCGSEPDAVRNQWRLQWLTAAHSHTPAHGFQVNCAPDPWPFWWPSRLLVFPLLDPFLQFSRGRAAAFRQVFISVSILVTADRWRYRAEWRMLQTQRCHRQNGDFPLIKRCHCGTLSWHKV